MIVFLVAYHLQCSFFLLVMISIKEFAMTNATILIIKNLSSVLNFYTCTVLNDPIYTYFTVVHTRMHNRQNQLNGVDVYWVKQ